MTVLVAYSDTSEGHAALSYGAVLSRKRQTPLVAFALDQPAAGDDSVVPPQPVPEGLKIDPKNIKWIGPDHQSADSTEDLLEAAEGIDAEQIIVGVRRRSRVGKLLLGSRAQKIIIGSDVPVTAVKADQ